MQWQDLLSLSLTPWTRVAIPIRDGTSFGFLMESMPSMEDVLRYVTDQLSDVELRPAISTSLAHESGGLFDWARLACAYVNGENSAGAGLNVEVRFTTIMARSKDVPLLDGMYRLTLETMFPKEEPARRRCIDHS